MPSGVAQGEQWGVMARGGDHSTRCFSPALLGLVSPSGEHPSAPCPHLLSLYLLPSAPTWGFSECFDVCFPSLMLNTSSLLLFGYETFALMTQ